MFSDRLTIDIPTACEVSGLSRSFIYELMGRGDLRSVKAGRRRLIVAQSLEDYIAALPSGGLTGSNGGA